MVELAQGEVVESRRGGADVLARLTNDMARLGRSGHIRIERRPKGIMPRVSQIVLREGRPILALHEADNLLTGLEALLEIESDCSALDATISLHLQEREDVDNIAKLFPTAYLDLEAENISNHREGEGEWWTKSRVIKSTWKREERLPELEPSVETSEFIRQKSKVMLERHGGIVEMLSPGQALIYDSEDPAKLFQLTSDLATHGRPVLVISRYEVEELNVKYDLPIQSCLWLTNAETENSLDPSLEGIKMKIDAFLWANSRAVVAFEGLEYLASIHGDERMIGMIRDICDGVKLEDHLFLSTADLTAFNLSKRQLLIRELDLIKPEILDHWLLEDDLLLDHPICTTPDQDEVLWIESQLKTVLGEKLQSPVSTADSMHGITGGEESLDPQEISDATGYLSAMMQEWAGDSELKSSMQIETSQSIITPSAQGPSDDWTPTFHSGETTEEESASKLVQPTAIQQTLEEDNLDSALDPVIEQIPIQTLIPAKTTGPRKATIVKRAKKSATLPPIITRKHTMQTNAAIQVAKDSPKLPELTVTAQPEKHLSRSIKERDIIQRKALDKTFQPISYKQDLELQQASVQSAAKHIAILPPTSAGPKILDVIGDIRPIGTETKLTPSMALDSNNSIRQHEGDMRESASRSQSSKTIDFVVEEWKRLGSKRILDSSTLYDKEGNAIERYGDQ
ncbi:MAG: DUF835 domain-containing protein [archaeon]|nr:DUF835 domain-containing protein [archaeon]MDA1131094.1 DUF835 domain-containing protein [archaeon]